MAMYKHSYDLNEEYRRTQSQIYGLQETILNSAKNASGSGKLKSAADTLRQRFNEPEHTSVGCDKVLQCVKNKYGPAPSRVLATLEYHPYHSGGPLRKELPAVPAEIQSSFSLAMPRPFLPGFSEEHINQLVTIQVSYEDLRDSYRGTDSPRAQNNEIWGCNIYTDDSDPLLVLRHCGLSISDYNGAHRTPANAENSDNVQGTVPPEGTPFDLEVDILLLPTLQSYPGVKQFGVTSRAWGIDTPTPHDGLSYGIYAIRITSRDTSTRNIDPQHQRVDTSHWETEGPRI
ncbi:hypothetical protein HG536_0E01920 [Torulaspora globosa]|uniref:Uncharacterized protein n=1 Tax=Torulaspora globosa TaxID=48254 RepID=A0A7G3ZIE5_9SACH|nr:uncharacterized protein HG536_0E01920 [Torulaspora globosa]QLL33281.1 hypothetical protein HG536_0E01920 [Torulaspora globosa]